MGGVRLTALLAVPLLTLPMLGTLPGDARAGICGKKRFNFTGPCVDSKDVKDNSLKVVNFASTGRKQRKRIQVGDEAGLNDRKKTGLGAQQVVLGAPVRGGWALATASAQVGTSAPGAAGIVRCDLVAIGRRGATLATKSSTTSVNPAKGISIANMVVTLGFPVRKGNTTVRLTCSQLSGNVDVGAAELIVQFFPTRYRVGRLP